MELTDVIVWYSQPFSMKGLVYCIVLVLLIVAVPCQVIAVMSCLGQAFHQFYKITRSDPDSALGHVWCLAQMKWWIKHGWWWQRKRISLRLTKDRVFEYFDCSVFGYSTVTHHLKIMKPLTIFISIYVKFQILFEMG